MEIKVLVKQAGRKHPLIKEKSLEIADIGNTPTLKVLLEAIVEQQVNEYNNKIIEAEDEDSTKSPLDNYLGILTETGKAGFGSIYNANKADLLKAQETAILAFQDGIFAVFLDEEELTDLQQTIEQLNNKTLTFIRLTFLAGSYW